MLRCFIFVAVYVASQQGLFADEASSCQHDANTFRCVKYLKNYDGDTITVEIPDVHPFFGHRISVRVNGIDTAEVRTKDKCEKQASRTARRLVESQLRQAKRIDLVNIERDKYFRVLANVMVDGNSLKDLLLKNRLAVAYDGGTKKKVNWCQMIGAASSEKSN